MDFAKPSTSLGPFHYLVYLFVSQYKTKRQWKKIHLSVVVCIQLENTDDNTRIIC